ncbi:MAG: ferrochelatase [Burkholderiaceae bacterium]
MAFAKEPPVAHGQTPTTAVLLCNLGTPAAPTPGAVRTYLAQFLADPRVVEIPALLWKPILYGLILPFRPRQSAAKYASIWMPEGSPLMVWTKRQAAALQQAFDARGGRVTVRYAMRYGSPSIASELDALKAAGAARILILPAYPQYSGTTTASIGDAVGEWLARQRNQPEMRWVRSYPADEGYVAALADSISRYWAANGQADKLVLSFHGVPERTRDLGDPYYEECLATARQLTARLGLREDQFVLTFQSRFGKAKWLEPATATVLEELGKAGTGRVDVVCPGFSCDCLETLEEISMEGREIFLHAGGREFHYIPCLNDSPAWIEAMATITQQQLAGWPGGGT